LYAALLGAAIYFTRATLRRALGALTGGLAVAGVGPGVEALAHTLGWWRYPGVDSAYGPPMIYPAVLLAFAILPLIGWRVTRRFGLRGQAVFLAALALVGTLRDYGVAARIPDFFVMGRGPGPALADAA